MIAGFMRKHGSNGVNAVTIVFCHKSFAYPTAATPVLTLADHRKRFQCNGYLPGDEGEFFRLSHGDRVWGTTKVD